MSGEFSQDIILAALIIMFAPLALIVTGAAILACVVIVTAAAILTAGVVGIIPSGLAGAGTCGLAFILGTCILSAVRGGRRMDQR